MKEIRLANKIIRTTVKDRMHYPSKLVADMFSIIARCGVLLLLYWYVYQLNGGAVQGTSYPVIAWSIFFYFILSMLRVREIARAIMKDVQTGNVELLFSKPIEYLSYKAWWQIGSGLYPFLVAAFFGVLTLVIFVGIPETMQTPLFLPTMLLAALFGTALALALYMLIGLLAFWIEDINPLFWIIDKSIVILGGSYLPIALFPTFLYNLALYTPFGATKFLTHTVNESWQYDWYKLVGLQLVWVIILWAVVYWLFRKAQKKVSVNGG